MMHTHTHTQLLQQQVFCGNHNQSEVVERMHARMHARAAALKHGVLYNQYCGLAGWVGEEGRGREAEVQRCGQW